MPSSIGDEEHPEVNPQTPGGAARKLRGEAGEGEGIGGKVQRAA